MTTSYEQLLLQFQFSGFCVLSGVIPTIECEAVRNNVVCQVERQSENYPNTPKNVGFTPSIINHDQSFSGYLAHDTLLALIEEILGQELRISFTSAIINLPGNERGDWHADWPFNQKNAGHVLAPYPDAVMHITTLWMLSPFSQENGGTLVLPGSHRSPTNPTAADGADSQQLFPSELNITGPAGSVLIMDSRLWHATAPNLSAEPRVALAVRYAPWWLNLEILRPGSDERKRMCEEAGKTENLVPAIKRDVFASLPCRVKQLYRHWVES